MLDEKNYITALLDMTYDPNTRAIEVYAPGGKCVYRTTVLSGNPVRGEAVSWLVEHHADDIQDAMEELGYVCQGDWGTNL